MNLRLTHPYRLVLASVLLLLWCLGFGWWQSGEGRVGGPMSPAKVLWLFLALWHFYVLPFALWRDQSLSPCVRKMWGLFLLGFVLRALVEVPLLLLTRAWRCEHGIAHDAIMMILLIVMTGRIPSESSRAASAFAWLVGIALVFEAINAWLFRDIGNPAEGIYFASDDARFRMINQVTWAEVALLLPLVIWRLVRYVRTSS